MPPSSKPDEALTDTCSQSSVTLLGPGLTADECLMRIGVLEATEQAFNELTSPKPDRQEDSNIGNNIINMSKK